MKMIACSTFKRELKRSLDDVLKSQTPLLISRSKGNDLVVIARSDYDSMVETLHLLQNRRNRARLARSVAEFDQVKTEENKLPNPAKPELNGSSEMKQGG